MVAPGVLALIVVGRVGVIRVEVIEQYRYSFFLGALAILSPFQSLYFEGVRGG